MGNLSFCKLSYRTFKRLNSCESSDFCESGDFGPRTRPSATLPPGEGLKTAAESVAGNSRLRGRPALERSETPAGRFTGFLASARLRATNSRKVETLLLFSKDVLRSTTAVWHTADWASWRRVSRFRPRVSPRISPSVWGTLLLLNASAAVLKRESDRFQEFEKARELHASQGSEDESDDSLGWKHRRTVAGAPGTLVSSVTRTNCGRASTACRA